MYQPAHYDAALALMLVSMVCWGSWANTLKLTDGWRFELFYWDYVIGVICGALAWGLTLGSLHGGSSAFLPELAGGSGRALLLAVVGGIVFNLANLALVAAIELAGLAVAFPVGIGLALVVGTLLSYVIQPRGNPIFLFGGIGLVMVAILLSARAYFLRDGESGGGHGPRRGLRLALVCGVLMGSFYPFVAAAQTGAHALGPYSVSLVFAFGVAICAIPVNLALMRRPVTGAPPVGWSAYTEAIPRRHLLGVVGGFIWITGAVASFVAGHAALVGPATSYAMGQGATMISAAWGVLVWREFARAPRSAKRLLAPMFVLFVIGLGTIAVAPLR